LEAVLQFFRRNRLAYQGLSVVLLVLVISAVGLLGYPVYTNFEQGRIQDDKSSQLESTALKKRYANRQLEEGDALTRIKIPKIGVDMVVVEGTTPSAPATTAARRCPVRWATCQSPGTALPTASPSTSSTG
jgi:hypothetical protein